MLNRYEFDWLYYLESNPDLRSAGITTQEQSYQHWRQHGFRERRKYRKLGGSLITTAIPRKKDVTLAIMIHMYDVRQIKFFESYINRIKDVSYDIYINVVKDGNPYGQLEQLKEYMTKESKSLQNVKIYYNENRGGDIGGLLLMSKQVIDSKKDYDYVIFVHTKSKLKWRIELCRSIFNVNFNQLTTNMGIIGTKKWVYRFDPNKTGEFDRYRYHMIDLFDMYHISQEFRRKEWSFIGGTMFICNYKIIRYIVEHQIDQVYGMLNTVDSIDVNWMYMMSKRNKDLKGTVNDYQYRRRYGRSLISDYMIEHAYERIIGLISNHMGLQMTGI